MRHSAMRRRPCRPIGWSQSANARGLGDRLWPLASCRVTVARVVNEPSLSGLVGSLLMFPEFGVEPRGIGVRRNLEEQVFSVGERVLGEPGWIEPEAG